MNVLTGVTLSHFQVEKEKIHEHERACSYEHLNLLLHFIMGIKVSVESLQPQGLELASHKLEELQQSLCELEVKLGQLSAGAPVQGPCVPCTTLWAVFIQERVWSSPETGAALQIFGLWIRSMESKHQLIFIYFIFTYTRDFHNSYR